MILMKLALPCEFYTPPCRFTRKTVHHLQEKVNPWVSVDKFLKQMRMGDFSSLMYSSPEETKEEPAAVVQRKKVVEKEPLPEKWVNLYNRLKNRPGPPVMFRLEKAMVMANENMDNYDLSVL